MGVTGVGSAFNTVIVAVPLVQFAALAVIKEDRSA